MVRLLVFAVLVMGLAACATTSDVVSIGNGHYEVTGSSATAMASGASQKVKLIKVANQYCGKQGKSAELVSADSNNGQVGSGAFVSGNAYGPRSGASYGGSAIKPGSAANADVIFRCQ